MNTNMSHLPNNARRRGGFDGAAKRKRTARKSVVTTGKSSVGGGMGGTGGEAGSNRPGCGCRQVGTHLASHSVRRTRSLPLEREWSQDAVLDHAGQKCSLKRAAEGGKNSQGAIKSFGAKRALEML
jgi:hypothetical protein